MTSNLETTLIKPYRNLDIFLIYCLNKDYFVFKYKVEQEMRDIEWGDLYPRITLKEFLLKLKRESFQWKTTLVFHIAMICQYHYHWSTIINIRQAIHDNPRLRNKQKVFIYWYELEDESNFKKNKRDKNLPIEYSETGEFEIGGILLRKRYPLDNEYEFYCDDDDPIYFHRAHIVQQLFLDAWDTQFVCSKNMKFVMRRMGGELSPECVRCPNSFVAFYCYASKPSIAFIINHDTFDSPRKGSEHDLINLYNAFTEKDIPQVILKDGILKEVKFFSKMFREINFSGLKYLFVVINSHGKEGDIIRASETEEYNLRDMILKPIWSNPSLKRVMKIILVSACRGEKEGTEHNYNETIGPAVESNDFSFMDNNTVIVYSSANGYRSYRFPESGSHFIKIFCEKFGENWDELDLYQLTQNMNNALEIYTSSDESKPTQHCQLKTLDKGYKIKKMEKSNDRKLRKTFLTIEESVERVNQEPSVRIKRRKVLTKPIIEQHDDN